MADTLTRVLEIGAGLACVAKIPTGDTEDPWVHVVYDAGDTAAWWSRNRPTAPGAIREEFTHACSLVSAQPRIGACVANTRLEAVRRVHLRRVRYHVYYRATSAAVEVLACWHSSRGRGPAL